MQIFPSDKDANSRIPLFVKNFEQHKIASLVVLLENREITFVLCHQGGGYIHVENSVQANYLARGAHGIEVL